MTAADAQFETIRISKSDGVATIALDRPEVLNAYNLQMRDDLSQVLDWLDADPDVHVCVFMGHGRAFCAGGDLLEFETAPSVLTARKVRMQRDVWKRLLRLPQPTIAALHGHVIGSGLELALCCDLRYAAEDASLSFPEVRLGFIPLAGGTQLLPRLAGTSQAVRTILTGAPLSAQEALRSGLLARVLLDAQDAQAHAHDVARRIASFPAADVQRATQALRLTRDAPPAEGFAVAATLERIRNIE